MGRGGYECGAWGSMRVGHVGGYEGGVCVGV